MYGENIPKFSSIREVHCNGPLNPLLFPGMLMPGPFAVTHRFYFSTEKWDATNDKLTKWFGYLNIYDSYKYRSMNVLIEVAKEETKRSASSERIPLLPDNRLLLRPVYAFSNISSSRQYISEVWIGQDEMIGSEYKIPSLATTIGWY